MGNNTMLAGPNRGEISSGSLFCFGAGAARCGRSLFVEISYSPIMGYSGCGEARFGCRGANRSSRKGSTTPAKMGGKRMPSDVRRRDFIALLSGALASRPISAHAQQAHTHTVGVLMGLANDAEARARMHAFGKGLEQAGDACPPPPSTEFLSPLHHSPAPP